MALEYRVLSWGDEVATERVALWEDQERIAAPALRAIDIVGTDESVDRHNTKIMVDGWQLDDYRKNPTFLWCHNQDPAVSTMPIGRIIGIYRESYARANDQKVGKRLAFRVEFPPEGTYPFADLVHKMYDGKFLRASSVGFRNIKLRRLDPSDEEDKKILDEDGFDAKAPYGAAILEKNALMELSAVPVGSNPNALVKALREATPEQHRGLMACADASQIDDAWVAQRFELLREALAPQDAESESVSPAKKATAPIPTADAAKHVTSRAIASVVDVPVVALPAADVQRMFDVLRESLSQQFKTELEALRAAISFLTERIAEAGDAERVAGDEPIAPEAASPLDVLCGENEETLRRISSLLQK